MAGEPGAEERTILDAEQIRRALDRIAHEILERNGGANDLLLVGVRTRGSVVATRLAERVRRFEGAEVPTIELDARPYRDDRSRTDQRNPLPCRMRSPGVASSWWTTCCTPGAPPAPQSRR